MCSWWKMDRHAAARRLRADDWLSIFNCHTPCFLPAPNHLAQHTQASPPLPWSPWSNFVALPLEGNEACMVSVGPWARGRFHSRMSPVACPELPRPSTAASLHSRSNFPARGGPAAIQVRALEELYIATSTVSRLRAYGTRKHLS